MDHRMSGVGFIPHSLRLLKAGALAVGAHRVGKAINLIVDRLYLLYLSIRHSVGAVLAEKRLAFVPELLKALTGVSVHLFISYVGATKKHPEKAKPKLRISWGASVADA
jgi:hypothetical protein